MLIFCILDQELQLVEVIAKGNTVYKKKGYQM